MQHLIKSELRRRKDARHRNLYERWLTERLADESRNRNRPILQDEIEYPEAETFCFELKNRK